MYPQHHKIYLGLQVPRGERRAAGFDRFYRHRARWKKNGSWSASCRQDNQSDGYSGVSEERGWKERAHCGDQWVDGYGKVAVRAITEGLRAVDLGAEIMPSIDCTKGVSFPAIFKLTERL